MDDDLGPLSESEAANLEDVDEEYKFAPSQTVAVRFSADELRVLTDEAARCHMTLSSLLRRAALESIRAFAARS
jgi:hypothetical protein